MHERAAVQEQRGLECSPHEPRESGEHHDRADAALRAPLPGDCTATDQDDPDGEVSGDEIDAATFVGSPLDGEADSDPQRQKRKGPHACQPAIAAASVSPESSLFGMKDNPGLAASRRRNEPAVRLEIKTIAGPYARIRSATPKPSRSGSCTSSSTTSGRSRLTASIAEAPSAASPTTSNPPAWSSAWAADRNPAWSSTMRTVGPTHGLSQTAFTSASGRALTGTAPKLNATSGTSLSIRCRL